MSGSLKWPGCVFCTSAMSVLLSRLDMMEDQRAWMSPPVRHTSQLTAPDATHAPHPVVAHAACVVQLSGPQLEHAIRNGRPAHTMPCRVPTRSNNTCHIIRRTGRATR